MDKQTRAAWGPRIRAARLAAGLEIQEVAEQANTNRRTLSDFERGKSVAHEDVIHRLIAVLSLGDGQVWDADIEILSPAIMTLIQHIDPESRARAVAVVVDTLATFIGNDIIVDAGEVID